MQRKKGLVMLMLGKFTFKNISSIIFYSLKKSFSIQRRGLTDSRDTSNMNPRSRENDEVSLPNYYQ